MAITRMIEGYRTLYGPRRSQDPADYVGSRREAMDAELAHETPRRDPYDTRKTGNLATTAQARYLRALLAEAERVGYAHGYRYGFAGPGLLKVEASQAIDRLVAAKRNQWRG